MHKDSLVTHLYRCPATNKHLFSNCPYNNEHIIKKELLDRHVQGKFTLIKECPDAKERRQSKHYEDDDEWEDYREPELDRNM